MTSILRPLAIGALALIAGTSWTLAADKGGCGAFKWSLNAEFGWMSDQNVKTATSGEKLALPPESALVLKLTPQASMTYAVPPTSKPKAEADKMFGGIITFESVPRPGIYQVTLSSGGWLDAVQNGGALKPVAHTGVKDCAAIRKSVRFEIGAGPWSVQLIDVENDTIKITVRAAD